MKSAMKDAMKSAMKSLILFLTVMTVPAMAQTMVAKSSKIKTQEIRFDALDIDGKSRTPDASYLSQKRGIKFMPLYKTKQDWEKKIQELAEYER